MFRHFDIILCCVVLYTVPVCGVCYSDVSVKNWALACDHSSCSILYNSKLSNAIAPLTFQSHPSLAYNTISQLIIPQCIISDTYHVNKSLSVSPPLPFLSTHQTFCCPPFTPEFKFQSLLLFPTYPLNPLLLIL
jgi:hypothetical protein